MMFAQVRQLFRGLDAFRDDLELQRMGHANDGQHDAASSALVVMPRMKAMSIFTCRPGSGADRPNWNSRSRIVDRYSDADVAKVLQRLDRALRIRLSDSRSIPNSSRLAAMLHCRASYSTSRSRSPSTNCWPATLTDTFMAPIEPASKSRFACRRSKSPSGRRHDQSGVFQTGMKISRRYQPMTGRCQRSMPPRRRYDRS